DVEVVRVYEPTSVLLDLISAGQRPDVIIGVTASLVELANTSEHLKADAIRGLVRSAFGVAAAPDAGPIVLQTVQDLRALLQRASSVAYSASGASGGVFKRVLDELGMTEEVAAKAVVLAKGFTAE